MPKPTLARRALPVVRSEEEYPFAWYAIMPSSALRRRPRGVRRLGRDLVAFRRADGAAVIADARCPHRGADLAAGRVVNGELTCRYHGFRFRGDGSCAAVPCEGEGYRPSSRMSLSTFPTREAYGFVWLGHGPDVESLPLPVTDDTPDGTRGSVVAELTWDAPYPRVIEGQMDIHHFPFAHRPFARVGTRLDPFEVDQEGDVISFSGRLRKEDGPRDRGGLFMSMKLRFPGTLVAKLSGVVLTAFVTPVDATRTYLAFRYTHTWPLVGKLIAWLAVVSELQLIQPDDEAMLVSAGPDFDASENCYVPSDRAFLLWHKEWRSRERAALRSPQRSRSQSRQV